MSTLHVERRQYTPEELLTMPDGDMYELVDGQLVERKMGWKSGWVGTRLASLLTTYCDENGLGWVAGADSSYQCFPSSPRQVRKPDVSFIRIDRLPADEAPEGHCRIAPDLAVEVVSPNDFYSEVEEKVKDYLDAKVPLIWIVDPATRTARAHRIDGSVKNLNLGDELEGEDVVPGFHCPLATLFRPPGAGPSTGPLPT